MATEGRENRGRQTPGVYAGAQMRAAQRVAPSGDTYGTSFFLASVAAFGVLLKLSLQDSARGLGHLCHHADVLKIVDKSSLRREADAASMSRRNERSKPA